MKMLGKLSVLIAMCFFTASVSYGAKEKEYRIQPNSSVEFVAIGNPSLLKIHGTGAAPSGTLALEKNTLSGTIDVALESIDTGMGLRNRHMHDKYLKTKQYPSAKLILEPISLPTGEFTELSKPFSGTLRIQETEKPVNGEVILTRKNDLLNAVAKLKIKITDFGIEIPSFAGITVADKVIIESKLKTTVERM